MWDSMYSCKYIGYKLRDYSALPDSFSDWNTVEKMLPVLFPKKCYEIH